MSLEELHAEIAFRLDWGERLADVQAELVETAGWLSDEERDALWLFAWSYRASRAHDGARHLELV